MASREARGASASFSEMTIRTTTEKPNLHIWCQMRPATEDIVFQLTKMPYESPPLERGKQAETLWQRIQKKFQEQLRRDRLGIFYCGTNAMICKCSDDEEFTAACEELRAQLPSTQGTLGYIEFYLAVSSEYIAVLPRDVLVPPGLTQKGRERLEFAPLPDKPTPIRQSSDTKRQHASRAVAKRSDSEDIQVVSTTAHGTAKKRPASASTGADDWKKRREKSTFVDLTKEVPYSPRQQDRYDHVNVYEMSAADQTMSPDCTALTVQLSQDYVRVVDVDWLSTYPNMPRAHCTLPGVSKTGFLHNEQDEDAAGMNEGIRDNMIRNKLETNLMIDRSQWEKFCAFLRFPPAYVGHSLLRNPCHPRTTITIPGWKAGLGLSPLQAYSSTWAISKLVSGCPLAVLALDMGIGKSAIALAVILMLRDSQKHITPTGNKRTLTYAPHSMPDFDLRKLGLQPIVKLGPFLIVVPNETLLINWKNEIMKFYRTDRRFRIVIAHLQTPRSSDFGTGGIYQGCYHITHTVERADVPLSVSSLGHSQGAAHASYTVHEILQGPARADQSKWIVLTTTQSATRWFKTEDPFTKESRTPTGCEEIVKDVQFCATILDECHSTNKIDAAPFPFFGGSRAFKLFLSATPNSKTGDLKAMVLACLAKHYTSTLSSPESPFDQRERSTSKGKDVWESLRPLGRTQERKDFLSQFLWSNVRKESQTIDKWVAGKRFNESGEDGILRAGDVDMPRIVSNATDTFREYVKKFMLYVKADAVWSPFEGCEAMPVVMMPPHRAFDIELDIGPQPDLAAWWKRGIQDIKQNQSGTICLQALIHQMRVLTFVPQLQKWVEDDPELKAEIFPYTKDKAAKLNDLQYNSILYARYMPRIVRSRTMQTLLKLLTQLRAEKNALGHPRKIVICAFKPINATIFYLALLRVIESGASQILRRRSDIVFLSSEADTKDSVCEEKLRQFTTTCNKKEGYKDQPGILVAVASKINSGINLTPADRVIQLDAQYIPALDIQLTGRVRRNEKVQLSRCTQSYRLITFSESSKLNINKLQTTRNASFAEIQRRILQDGPDEEQSAG